MSYEFKVGQQVVCVNESIVGVMINPSDQFFPRIGRLYTITGFETRNTPLDAALLCLLLKEHEVSFGRSGAWGVYRFRPLVSDTQQWLKEILETPPLVVTIKASEVIKSIWIAGY